MGTSSPRPQHLESSGHKIASYSSRRAEEGVTGCYSSTGTPLPVIIFFFFKKFCSFLYYFALKEPKPGKRSVYIQSPTPSNMEYRRTFHHRYTPCPTYSPTAPGGYNYSQSQDAMHAKPLLFAKIALHCYNLEKGTHFERLGLPRAYDQTLEARDPARNYTCRFETNVRLATENKDCFHVITTCCRPLPPPPPSGKMYSNVDLTHSPWMSFSKATCPIGCLMTMPLVRC